MKDETDKVSAAISGELLSSWAPHGLIRKIIFFMAIIYGGYELLSRAENGYWIFPLMIAIFMSPRLVGLAAFFIGRFASKAVSWFEKTR